MPSTDGFSRRAYLASAAAGVACLAGCSGTEDEATGPTDTPTDTPSPTATSMSIPSGTLTLELTPPDEVDGQATVYPPALRKWLRTAATTDRTVRAHGSAPTYVATPAYDPIPPLLAFDHVHLDDPDGDGSGTYDLSVEGGVRYELLVGAEAVSPPEDAEVTPVTSLPEARRDVALAAIGAPTDGEDDADRVYPETELGSWVRHELFGGYVSHDGTTYRGKEVQQTDAAFFSNEVWYVLSLSSTDADATTTLRLAEVDARVRRAIATLREDQETPKTVSGVVEGETANAAQAFAAETELLLTHDAVFRVGYEA